MHRRVRHRATVETATAPPIRLVVGPLSNATVDAMTWLFAANLGDQLQRPIFIEACADGQGASSLAAIARMGRDKFTLLLLIGSTTTSITTQGDGTRDRSRSSDLSPVALVFPLPQGRAASARVPAADLRGHIEWLRASGCEADGLYVPQGTPERVAEELAGAILRAFQTFDVREALARLGVDLVVLTGHAVRAYLDGEAA